MMYLDVVYNNKITLVSLGYIYISVNIIDLIMIVALIVDRDFLGLHKLKSKVLSLSTKNNLKYNQ